MGPSVSAHAGAGLCSGAQRFRRCRTGASCLDTRVPPVRVDDLAAQASLTFKGVVFNEMKGVYSSPDSMNQRHTQQAMFPDNTYAVDSGGDPVDIPNLSFDECAPAVNTVLAGLEPAVVSEPYCAACETVQYVEDRVWPRNMSV